MKTLLKASVAFYFFIFSYTAAADQIIVTDCTGNTLAMTDIDGGDARTVSMTLEQSAQAVEVVMKNAAAGIENTKISSAGKVKFKNIVAGNWKICLEPASAAIENVTIGNSRRAGMAVAGLFGGIGVLGAGIAAGDNSGGSGSEIRAAGEAAEEVNSGQAAAVLGSTNPPSDGESVTKKPLIEKHPCLAAAARGDQDKCGINEDITPQDLSPFL